MKSSNSSYRVGTAVALALAAAVAAGPARADLVLLGADYFATIQPTFFTPLGALNPLAGLPIGPGNTDTIVHRQGDCSLSLATLGSNCTIPIEVVALSLVSTVDPMVRVRETPGSVVGTSLSGGMMTITSDGSGTGGTFNSFFDIFFELSVDGGNTYQPYDADPGTPGIDPKHFIILTPANWTTIELLPPFLLVDGLLGDQNANRHINKVSPACPVFGNGVCVDFYLAGAGGGIAVHEAPDARHTVRAAMIPEPSSWALLSLGLVAIAGLGGRGARRVDVRADKAPADSSGPV